jgi:hypothetical protein
MTSRPITLHSPLSPVALATKLRAVLGDADDKPKPGVTGHGSQQDMMLFVYRPYIRDGFAARLTATMEPKGGGTRITGQIGPPSDAGCTLLFWVVFLSVILLLTAGIGAVQGAPVEFWGPLTGIALIVIAVGAVLPPIGRRLARGDEAAILAFLADTVHARPR